MVAKESWCWVPLWDRKGKTFNIAYVGSGCDDAVSADSSLLLVLGMRKRGWNCRRTVAVEMLLWVICHFTLENCCLHHHLSPWLISSTEAAGACCCVMMIPTLGWHQGLPGFGAAGKYRCRRDMGVRSWSQVDVWWYKSTSDRNSNVKKNLTLLQNAGCII